MGVDIAEVVRGDMALMLEKIVATRMAEPQPQRFKHPLGFSTWNTEEVLAAIECLVEQKTTMWAKVEAFEHQFAQYLGSENAVMLNSGSSADLVMMLAARELGILKQGDEILIPAVTWPTQVWSALEAGFTVKLVDVETSTLNTSPEILEAAIGPKTKAIFLVHLMGNPCDMEGIQALAADRDLLIFEDCCEALGAAFDGRKVGSFGKASAFSFFASHHISTMEGGMIATDDPEFAEQCRLLRAHGWARDLRHRVNDIDVLTRYGAVEDPRYLFLGKGFNFRPTELQGAIGSIQLSKLETLNAHRQKNAWEVQNNFRNTNGHCVEGLLPTTHKAKPAWFALPFVLRAGLPYSRNEVAKHLESLGIDTRPIAAGNLARHPAMWKFPELGGYLPGANAIHDRGFYIGLPPIENYSMASVIGALNGFDSIIRTKKF